jgi:hypothetical protein
MFSHPARQNNSFRHRTDTKESLFAGKKLAIYQEVSAMPMRHCAFHKTVTSKPVTTDTPIQRDSTSIETATELSPAHQPENLGLRAS